LIFSLINIKRRSFLFDFCSRAPGLTATSSDVLYSPILIAAPCERLQNLYTVPVVTFNEPEDGMQAVAGHICYALAGLRDRDSKACKLVLVSRLNKLEDCVQAVAGHICYALAGLREREREITMPVYCAWCHISMNMRMSHVNECKVGVQAVAGHICYVLAGLHTQPQGPAFQLCAWCHISMNVRLVGMQEVAGHIRYILAGLRETER